MDIVSSIVEPILPPRTLDLRVVMMSTYPPKKCGIANYTKDLATSINSLNPNHLVEIIAMDDHTSENLTYPWEVSYRINNQNWNDYKKALNYLNKSIIDVVLIQHEYGIYGEAGNKNILEFTKKLNKPFIVTFHTILEKPNHQQKKVLQELSKRAQAVVVLLPAATEILNRVYNIPREKIVQIHLGTPDLPLAGNQKSKEALGLQDKIIMSSINLISQNKGFHHAIRALPSVVSKYPHFLYLIIGQTHPNVIEAEGEAYRKNLEGLVKQLNLESNVKFINKFITHDELLSYIKASDLYITPYLNLDQISSYALAYAISLGQICISTPYRYAKEMLVGRKGFLVEPDSPDSIAKTILYALNHTQEVNRMKQKCYLQGRAMTWARVGFRHIRMIDHLLRKAHEQHGFPKPSLDYLNFLTDEIGILEHTYKGRKNYKEGYATDDNARALVVAVQYGERKLANTYLDFLTRAQSQGLIYIDANLHGKFVGPLDCGDSFGRTFWAAAYTMAYGPAISLRQKSAQLIRKLLPTCLTIKYLRPLSHVLLGMLYLKDLEWDEFIEEREKIIQYALKEIMSGFKKSDSSNWHWPEEILVYDNPKIPQALLEIADSYNLPEIKEVALKMLDFLIDQTFDLLHNHFRFIGNRGWFPKGSQKALFDEQPIEAGATVQACLIAFRVTGLDYYREMAEKAFAWFHGDNILRQPLYNQEKSSVFDGILQENISLNQGAESTLEYLLAYHYYGKMKEEEKRQK